MFSRQAEKVLFCNYCDFLWPQPGPAPREGPACLGSCCHPPSHCPATLPCPQGPPLPCLPHTGRTAAPSALPPFRRDSVTWSWACRPPFASSVPTAQLSGPAAPPRGGCSTRRLLEAPTVAPPASTGTQACTDLPFSQSVDKGACGLADPRAFHITSAPAPILGKSPRVTGCLPAHLPWTEWGLARRDGIGRGCCCPHPSSPLFPPKRPGSGTTERHLRGCATLASPGPESPSPGLGRASSAQNRRGPAWAGWHSARGTWGRPPHSGAPLAVQPHVPSVPPPPGRHLARSMPPRASRCRVVSRPPLGLGRRALPSHPHSPGRSSADF